MARRVAVSTLNASTIDILNTIRANASAEYQSQVPAIESVKEIPRVGEVICGYPALANQFLSALVNRIAAVRIKSAVFNNAYADLKKGYLEFGETVEEVFVQLAKAREFSAEKASARELARTLPKVKSAFHALNYKVQYPVTIQDEDLRMAFTSADGVQDLISRIIESVYTAAEYDEFLLFKYLLIKAISHGKLAPVAVGGTGTETDAAIQFRAASNKLTFLSDAYNAAGVHTSTPREDQYIFMDAEYNAQFDVNVLAAAFHMEKADFMGRLKLIDNWTSFDNERFSEIVANSDQMEEVSNTELGLMAGVKAVLVDKEWFQIYDNLSAMTEQHVGSGLYHNYFYNVWKTVSSSPFSNAIVFVANSVNIEEPSTLTVSVIGKDTAADVGTVFTLNVADSVGAAPQNYRFVQTSAATSNGIAVHPYGAVIFPAANVASLTLVVEAGGATYTAGSTINTATEEGTTITLTKVENNQ